MQRCRRGGPGRVHVTCPDRVRPCRTGVVGVVRPSGCGRVMRVDSGSAKSEHLQVLYPAGLGSAVAAGKGLDGGCGVQQLPVCQFVDLLHREGHVRIRQRDRRQRHPGIGRSLCVQRQERAGAQPLVIGRNGLVSGRKIAKAAELVSIPDPAVLALRPIRCNRRPSVIVTGRTNTLWGRPIATSENSPGSSLPYSAKDPLHEQRSWTR